MSSGFVPAGSDPKSTQPDDAWQKAQQEVIARRSVKTDPGKQDDGKSLYEILQQNKAAKQDAFEESIRLKNQFRSLDDDEVDFLDSVLESTRAKEDAVRKETAERLEAFRKQREAAEIAQLEEDNKAAPGAGASGSRTQEESWAAKPKKRRREKDPGPSPVAKLRKASSTEIEKPSSSDLEKPNGKVVEATGHPASNSSEVDHEQSEKAKEEEEQPTRGAKAAPPVAALGLGVYSSDEDY